MCIFIDLNIYLSVYLYVCLSRGLGDVYKRQFVYIALG